MNLDFDYEKCVRTLAKSNKYQTIFCNERPLGLKLFVNDVDFTSIQISFLNWLSFYYSLAFDFSMGDVGDIVFKDDIYADAYAYYKNKKRNNGKKNKTKNDAESNSIPHQGKNVENKRQWVFKTPRKANKK
jgi:uncharacterized membrane-anchored protein YitT (DUF2179 family)